MSTDRDTTRIVRSWLEEGVTALPDRVLDDVLDQLPATPQRPATWWPTRRFLDMNNMVKLALSTAAIVIVALLGLNFVLPGGNVGAPQASPTPQPTSADGEPVVREWIAAVNDGDANALRRLTAERVDTDGPTVDREDKIAEVLDTWCPMTVNSIERVGDAYLVGVEFTDNADSTCTAGPPGTTSSFVLEVRDGKVARTP